MDTKYYWGLGFVVLLWLGLLAGVVIYFSSSAVEQQYDTEQESAERVQDKRTEEVADLARRAKGEGFWYQYKDEYGAIALAFFDPSQELHAQLSEQEYLDTLLRLQNSDFQKAGSVFEVLEEDELSDSSRVYNAIVRSPQEGNYLETKKALQAKQDDFSRSMLAYMSSFEGDYEEAGKLREEYCAEYPNSVECQTHRVRISGKVENVAGEPQVGAWVQVITSEDSAVKTLTNTEGMFSLNYQAYPYERIRVQAGKRNFSTGVSSFANFSTSGRSHTLTQPIVISAPLDVYTIDPNKRLVTGETNEYNGSSYIVNTERSRYSIPADAIVDEQGEPYQGLIDVYVYEFDRDNLPEGLSEVDTFDQVMGYAGDLMKTFGMPYIQFFRQDTNEELHVFSNNPMHLRTQVYHMDYLYENRDGHYRKLTPEDMGFLYRATINAPTAYPIDRQFLIDNNLLTFPAFWVFDQRRGVWDNVGMGVVDPSGVVETEFYTSKNNS